MTRLNFPYFMNENAINYIIEAVKMVAKDGWKLLPQVCVANKCCIVDKQTTLAQGILCTHKR